MMFFMLLCMPCLDLAAMLTPQDITCVNPPGSKVVRPGDVTLVDDLPVVPATGKQEGQ